MIEARKYQSDCVEKIWSNFHNKDDQLIVLPTASGKTIIFTLLLKKCLEAYPELKAMVLVNQVKLVNQTKEKLKLALKESEVSLFCGSIGEYNSSNAVTVGSVLSVSKETQFINLLIIDEAHNADGSATYKNYIKRLSEANPKLKIVRFTATPYTINGYIYGEDKPNKLIDYKKTMLQMIEEKYIVSPTFKNTKSKFDMKGIRKKRGEYIMRDLEELSMDLNKAQDQVKDALSRLDGRNKVVWSCTCIAHAEMIKGIINQYEDATVIHSKLKDGEKIYNMNLFEKGTCRHIVSVTMVSEGYDFPAIDAIVCLRPTRSPVLYVQLCGRGLRLYPGKKDCLFLDYGDIVENLGHPNDPVVIKKRKGDVEKQIIICPSCEEINFLPVSKCKDCSYEFFKEEVKEEVKRNVTKKLLDTACEVHLNENGRIEQERSVLSLNINKGHISKAGNHCWHLSYATMQGPVQEYIAVKSRFYDDFYRDFKLMGNPKKLVLERHGKYWKVKERLWS